MATFRCFVAMSPPTTTMSTSRRRRRVQLSSRVASSSITRTVVSSILCCSLVLLLHSHSQIVSADPSSGTHHSQDRHHSHHQSQHHAPSSASAAASSSSSSSASSSSASASASLSPSISVSSSDFDAFNDVDEMQVTALCDAFKGPTALGMESGVIPDGALSASSSFNEQSVGPQNARLNRELNSGAWCPSSQIGEHNAGHEWIQVNFSEPQVITKIATQGRFGNSLGVEFAEHYWLHYSRDGGVSWIRWHNRFGDFEMQANVDTYSIVENLLFPPLVGVTSLRILPVSKQIRTCCLRFEVYGCAYRDGPATYSMNDGNYNGRFGELVDDTYDGYRRESGALAEGLGQLVDGIKGDEDYKLNKGYEWVGWRAPGANPAAQWMSITFEFAHPRNFTLASVHTHNLFTKEMAVFGEAEVWFSLDGQQWSATPEKFEYMPDNVMERPRDVVIHLHNRIGKFVRFDLRFASRWLLISEVHFDSRPLSRPIRLEELDFSSRPIIKQATSDSSFSHTFLSTSGVGGGHSTTSTTATVAAKLANEPLIFIGIAVGAFLIISTVLFVVLISKRRRKSKGTEYTTVPMKDVGSVSTHPLFCPPPNREHFGQLMAPYIGTADPEYAVPDLIGHGGTILSIGGQTTKINLNAVAPSPRTFRPIQRLNGGFGFTANKTHQDDARYYASTDVLGSRSLAYGLDHSSANGSVASRSPPPPPLNGSLSSNGSRTAALSSDYENSTLGHSVVPQIPDCDISVINGQFGFCKYGEVELGCWNRRAVVDKQLVVLKTLTNESQRSEFLAEMNEKWRLSTKCPDTFARLYGYVAKHDYFALAIEAGDADLKKYLRSSAGEKLRLQSLLDIALQIVTALQDLHSKGFIHRDMAARNCIIYGRDLKVKITDSGSLATEYKNEYFNGVMPLRWMSYETVIEGKFTEKSDVFAFGVTLWELLTRCRSLPHEHLSDQEMLAELINEKTTLIDESAEFYNRPFSVGEEREYETVGQLRLARPTVVSDTPSEIYDLILECCHRSESSRPTLREIGDFLKSKRPSHASISYGQI